MLGLGLGDAKAKANAKAKAKGEGQVGYGAEKGRFPKWPREGGERDEVEDVIDLLCVPSYIKICTMQASIPTHLVTCCHTL